MKIGMQVKVCMQRVRKFATKCFQYVSLKYFHGGKCTATLLTHKISRKGINDGFTYCLSRCKTRSRHFKYEEGCTTVMHDWMTEITCSDGRFRSSGSDSTIIDFSGTNDFHNRYSFILYREADLFLLHE